MSTVGEAITQLRRCGKQHVAVHIWCEDDVLGRAKENHVRLTRQQASDIIDEVDRHIDSEVGVTWDTLDYYIDDYRAGRRKAQTVMSRRES